MAEIVDIERRGDVVELVVWRRPVPRELCRTETATADLREITCPARWSSTRRSAWTSWCPGGYWSARSGLLWGSSSGCRRGYGRRSDYGQNSRSKAVAPRPAWRRRRPPAPTGDLRGVGADLSQQTNARPITAHSGPCSCIQYVGATSVRQRAGQTRTTRTQVAVLTKRNTARIGSPARCSEPSEGRSPESPEQVCL